MSAAMSLHEPEPTPVGAVEAEEFVARAHLDGARLIAVLSGNADLRIKDQLALFLEGIDQEALRARVIDVAVDLRELEFMNSSCFKDFVSWIAAVQARPAERQYAICFHSNPRMHWQRRSLNALCCFASELVSVQAL